MLVFRCDRCGRIYEEEEAKICLIGTWQDEYDLCDECMSVFKNWLGLEEDEHENQE